MDSPKTDEFQLLARMTGMKAVYKMSSAHALNQKAVCRFYAEKVGRPYQDMNFVVAHMDGGVSVTAHKKGMMVDSANIIHGDGSMAPTHLARLQMMVCWNLCDFISTCSTDRIWYAGIC